MTVTCTQDIFRCKILITCVHFDFYSFLDWRWFPSQKPYEILYHRQIVKYFGDNLSESSPFSIHRLVNIGKESGKLPGDWYGPASVAHVLRYGLWYLHLCQIYQFQPILYEHCKLTSQTFQPFFLSKVCKTDTMTYKI